MTRKPPQPITLSAPSFEARCRHCTRPVSLPVVLLLPQTIIQSQAKQPVVPVGSFTFIDRVADIAKQYSLDHGLILHKDDLNNTTIAQGAHGCCGIGAASGPNLLCKRSHLVGTLSDDCLDPHFVHLSLQHCELFPLPMS